MRLELIEFAYCNLMQAREVRLSSCDPFRVFRFMRLFRTEKCYGYCSGEHRHALCMATEFAPTIT